MSFNFRMGLLALLMGSACARPNYQTLPPMDAKPMADAEMQVTIDWEQHQTSDSTGSFLIRFTAGNELVSPVGEVKVVLWMPSMNHGSTPVSVSRISEGLYRASRVYFIMPGAWEIRIQIHQGDQIVQQFTEKFVY